MRNKRKGRSKGSKPKMDYKKGFESEDRDIQDDRGRKGEFRSSNDPAWYLKNRSLADWAGTINFNLPAGFGITSKYKSGAPTVPNTISGIMTFDVCPTIGVAASPSDAVNTLGVKYFNHIRKEVSGSRTYEAPDIMLYTIAAANLYSAYNWAARLYGLTFNFSQQNRYIGDAFLKASGVDVDDIRSNLADFRLFLNAYAAKISVFSVPASVAYFNRVNFLYSGIYADSNTAKAQIYMNVPNYFLKYDSTGNPNGGMLVSEVPVTYSTGAATVADIENTLNNLLNAMYYDSDMYTMSGDINKAFSGNLLIANPIAEDFNVPVLYDEAVLMQFNNATPVGGAVSSSNTTIVSQDANTGVLLCSVGYLDNDQNLDILPVLNFHKSDITVADIFEAIPFMVSLSSPGGAGGWTYNFTSMGTEYISTVNMYNINAINGTLIKSTFNRWIKMPIASSMTSLRLAEVGAMVTNLSQFDYHPQMFITERQSTSAPYANKVISDVFDYDVFAIIDDETLRKLHDIALWSLFTIDQ